MTAPVPVPAARLSTGDFVADVEPDDLVYFLVNVGDGDTQLILLPADDDGRRNALVVDCATERKLPALVEALADTPLLPERPELFALVIATHPHEDHIGGMGAFLDRFHPLIDEFWEPGYYHPSASYIAMMRAVEDRPIRHLQPTSGTTRFIGQVKLTVLGPSMELRNRFDSYGIDINNASLSIRVEFPASRVEQRDGDRRFLRRARRQSLILGADAQTESWAQVMGDFPELHPDRSPAAAAIGKAQGYTPLRADVFKVSHHGSKHGVNLELVERVDPKLTLFSSVAQRGKYNFPHAVTQEAIREAIEPTAASGRAHKPDHELGLFYTADRDSDGDPLGSIGLVLSPNGRKRSVWRFGDAPNHAIDFGAARRLT